MRDAIVNTTPFFEAGFPDCVKKKGASGAALLLLARRSRCSFTAQWGHREVGITHGAPGTDPHAHLWERVTPKARGSILLVERKRDFSLCHRRHFYLSQKPPSSDRDRSYWPERSLRVLWGLPTSKLAETFQWDGARLLGGPSPR